MKKIISAALLIALLCSLLAACSKKDAAVSSVDEVVINLPAGETSEGEKLPLVPSSRDGRGYYLNPLTGVFDVKKDAYGKRPYAVMVSNIKAALPQWGITTPDLCYEMLAEGSITRIVAFYADGKAIPKIGPMRSARTYHVKTALGYDSIFVHWGDSKSGNALMVSTGLAHLDGNNLDFPRDKDRLKKKINIEHTGYSDASIIADNVAKKKFRTDRENKDFQAFTFNDEAEEKGISVNGATTAATDISVTFSKDTIGTFKYNASDKLYYKGEFGAAQVDATTKAQVAVRNVIYITDKHGYEDDKEHRTIEQKAGVGYYFSDGQAIEIEWKKGKNADPYVFTLKDGGTLKLNPGKIWVCVVPKDTTKRLKFS
ncbi:MAG: DUF3048 domain-containing protein [Oscillospiraceae bacterium]|jgi:hypothetical protein|nr:DUF3048 domain-containing protein [Oscillospiraceae bacterium]